MENLAAHTRSLVKARRKAGLVRRAGIVCASTLWTVAALGGPTGENIVHGQGNVSRPDNFTTVIDQQTGSLGINWETFDVGANEHVIFNQPGADSLALNRIFDQNPSQIFGAIDANGNILLINPNGMVFGPNARLNINSLVASSLDLSIDDFKDGHYNLQALADQRGGIIVNHGLIEAAAGGSVTLIGDSVVNTGLIVADYGNVSLAAGEKATLDFDGDGLMLFSVDAALTSNTTGQEAAVANRGTIQADGGQVLLTASTARDVFTSVVNNEGVIRANRLESVGGGVVRLVGSGGTVRHSGIIDVTNREGEGGAVQILGDRVGLFDNALVDASGRAGGGEVLIGGDTHGANLQIANAELTYVSYDTRVRADATHSGDGGKIVVWSDRSSRIYGALSARGGADSGDGGFIETSGKIGLAIARTVDVTAIRGRGGEWLIDPNNLNIVNGSTNTNINNSDPFLTDNDSALLGVNLIMNALSGGATVTIETGGGGTNAQAGDITLAAGVTLDFDDSGSSAGAVLTLNAANDIIINGTIEDSVTDADTLTLNLMANNAAADDDTAAGDVIIGATGSISLGGGVFTSSGINFSNAGSVDTEGGSMALMHQGNFTNTGTLTAQSISISAGQGGGATFDIAGGLVSATTVNVTGGAGADVFNITTAVDSIDGAGGSDTADYTTAGAVTVDLGGLTAVEILVGNAGATLASGSGGDAWIFDATGSAGTVNGIAFSAFAALDAGAGTDTVASTETANTWVIGATSGVTVAGGTELANAETVTGGSGIDAFTINGDFGTLNGGAGADVFTVDADTNVSMAGSTGDDNFIINANVTGAANGDANDDTYTFSGDFSVTGLNGGAGTDDANYVTAGAVTVDLDQFTSVEALVGNAVATLDSGGGVDAWIFDATGTAGTVNGIGFSGFGTLDAGAGTDTVASTEAVNAWVIGAAGGVTVAGGTELANAETVTGGSGVDAFTINGDFGTLNGGAGADTFAVNANVTGAVNGDGGNDTFNYAGNFSVATLSGGAGSDTANYASAGATTVDLSAQPTDVEDYVGNAAATLLSGTGADAWVLGATGNSGTVNGANFSAFGSLDAGAGTDTVASTQAANSWVIGATGGVTVAGGTELANAETVTGGGGVDAFTINGNFGTLNGGAGADTFAINANVTGTVNGDADNDTFNYSGNFSVATLNGGAGSDTANYTAAGAVTVDLGAFTAVETLVGNAGATLNSGNANNAWIFDATGSAGTVDGMAFSAFGSLDAGAGTDTVASTGAANTWVIGATGGVAVASGTELANAETVTGGSGIDAFTINGDFGTLDGGAGADTFAINVNVTGTVNGDGGNDTFNYAGNFSVATLSGGAGSDTANYASAGATTVDLSAQPTDVEAYVGNAAATLLSGAGADAWVFDVTGTAGTVNGANFSAFGSLDAGAGTDTVASTETANSWVITAAGGVTVAGATELANAETVNGGSGIDAYTVNGDFGTLNGGAGNDTFAIGANVTGAVNGGGDDDTFNYLGNFAVTTLSGGSGSDTADYTLAGATIVDLSAQPNDVEDYVGSAAATLLSGTGADAWVFDPAGNSGTVNGANFSAFGLLDAGAGVDTVASTAAANLWIISIANSVNLDGGTLLFNAEIVNGGSGIDTFFIGAAFGLLNGNAGDDLFSVVAPVAVGLDGGAGTDTANYGGAGASIVDLDDQANIENFIGNAAATLLSGASADTWVFDATGLAGTVNGANFSAFGLLDAGGGADTVASTEAANSWVITAAGGVTVAGGTELANAETVNGGSGIDAFTINGDFGTLNGGAGADTFAISANVTGAVNGDGDGDTFNYSGNFAVTTLSGGAGTDTADYTLAGATTVDLSAQPNDIEAYVGNAAATLLSGSGADAWVLDMTGTAGTVNGANFSAFGSLDAGAGADTVASTETANSWVITATGGVTVAGGSELANTETVMGGSGIDTFSINGDFGTLNGNAGADIFNVLAASNAVLNGNDGNDIFNVGGDLSNAASGDAGDDTFNINANASGSVDGGADADRFVYSGDFAIGTLSGGSGDDTSDYGGAGALVVDLDSQPADIENYIGNNLAALLSGGGDDAWIMAASGDSGTVNGVNFSAFAMLDAGTGTDSVASTEAANAWVITAAGGLTVAGGSEILNAESVIGGSGVDTFDIGADFGSLNGGAGADQFTVSAASNATLAGGAGDDAFTLAADLSGSADGGAGNDRFNIDSAITGSLSGDADDDTFAYSGDFAVAALAGGAGNDTSDYAGAGALIVDLDAQPVDIEIFAGNAAAILLSGAGVDAWTLDAGGISGTLDADSNGSLVVFREFGLLDAGAGIDSVTGPAVDNMWFIAADGSVKLSAAGAPLGNVESLTGGSGVDIVSVLGNFGAIAGAGGDDVITLAAGVTTIIDGGAGSDTVVGSDTANVWTVDALDGGNLNGGVLFSAVENLQGGSDVDTFTVTASLSGSALGGDGNDEFNVLADFFGSLGGGGGNDTFTIDADVAQATGDDGDDVFNVAQNVASATLAGGAGNDALMIDSVGLAASTVTFDGGTQTDTITLAGGGIAVQGDLNTGTGVLAYTGGVGDFSLTIANVESIIDSVQALGLNVTVPGAVNAGIGIGTATPMNAVLLDIPGFTSIDFGNKANFTLDAPLTTLVLGSSVGLPGVIDLTVDALDNSGQNTVSANSLVVRGARLIGTLMTSVQNLMLDGVQGLFAIDENDDIEILSASVGGAGASLVINAGGNVQISGDVQSTGGVDIDSGGTIGQAAGTSLDAATLTIRSIGGTNLDSTGNQIRALTANNSVGGDIVVNSNGVLDIIAVNNTAGSVSIDATGAVSQSGDMSATQDIELVGQSITMASATSSISSSGDILYVANDNVAIAGLGVGTGAATVTVQSLGGNIFQVSGPGSGVTANTINLFSPGLIGEISAAVSVISADGVSGLLVIDTTGMGGPFGGQPSFVEESNVLFTKIGNRASTTIDTQFSAAAAAFAQSQASALSDATATDSSVFETEVQIVDTIGSGVMLPCGQSDDEEAECE